MTRKRGIAGCVAIIMLLAMVIVLCLLYISKSHGAEISQIRADFMQNHNGQIVSIAHPEKMYLVYWQNLEGAHVSLKINGLWIELGIVPE